MKKIAVIEYLIQKGPGRTERQLAHAIYGDQGTQQDVNQDCVLLERRGHIFAEGSPKRWYSVEPAGAWD